MEDVTELLKIDSLTISSGVPTVREGRHSRKEKVFVREPVILPEDREDEEELDDTLRSSISPSDDFEILPDPEDDSYEEFIHHPGHDEVRHFDLIPPELLDKMFESFDLKERARLRMVCRKFYAALSDGTAPLHDVGVLNIFERPIWEKSVRSNSVSRIAIHSAWKLPELEAILKNIRDVDSLKIWFASRSFAEKMLRVCSSLLRIRCVDIYPYETEMCLDLAAEYFPDVHGVTMRPHGNAHFFQGLELPSVPDFSCIHTMCIDSFILTPSCILPSTLRTLDYSHRKIPDFNVFIKAISSLHELEYLAVSHLELESVENMNAFMGAICIENMPRLRHLFFKFCRMGRRSPIKNRIVEAELKEKPPATPPPQIELEQRTLRLYTLKFDLVYGLTTDVVHSFLEATSSTLKCIYINVILEDDMLQTAIGLSPKLKKLQVELHLAMMQKTDPHLQPIRRTTESPFPRPPYTTQALKIPPEFFDVLTRFEGSFVFDKTMLKQIFARQAAHRRNMQLEMFRKLSKLQEIKFIKCLGVDDEIMANLALLMPCIRKMSIISCEDCTNEGLLALTRNIFNSSSPMLRILFKKNTQYSFQVLRDELILSAEPGQTVRFATKTFPDTSTGECITFKDENLHRAIVIRNYNPEDSSRIIGVVVSTEAE